MGDNIVGSWDADKEVIFSKLVGNCPEARIQLRSVSTNCLLDSGSEISAVTESLFKESLES